MLICAHPWLWTIVLGEREESGADVVRCSESAVLLLFLLCSLSPRVAVADTVVRPYPDPGYRLLGIYGGGPPWIDYEMPKIMLRADSFPDKKAWWAELEEENVPSVEGGDFAVASAQSLKIRGLSREPGHSRKPCMCTILWYTARMRLDRDHLASVCRERGTSLSRLLRDSGVSRNAYYALARKPSILPRSIERLAECLGVSASSLLTDEPVIPAAAQRLLREIDTVVRDHPGIDRDHVRHTLILLDEPPIERLRRALRRGRS